MPLLLSASFDPRFTNVDNVDTNEKFPTFTMNTLASVGAPQPYGGTISPSTVPQRPPELCAFSIVNLRRPEFEPVLAVNTMMGNPWDQAHTSTTCSTRPTSQDMHGTSVENEYATFDGEYDYAVTDSRTTLTTNSDSLTFVPVMIAARCNKMGNVYGNVL